MQLEEYHPRSNLVTSITEVNLPRCPVIDAHNHLSNTFIEEDWMFKPVNELVDRLDEAGVSGYIDLDGGWGEAILQAHLDKFKSAAPERFHIFGGVSWKDWSEHGDQFGDWAAGRLRQQVSWGAEGLKIWKGFGLTVQDQDGLLVKIDDPRLDPIWETAGELHLPVTIHIADPVAFFRPLDGENERWEELHHQPDWHFPSPPFPPFLSLLTALYNLVSHHPKTTFIGAHVGCYSENLVWVAQMLDACPNYYVDIAARISELGRQPYSARNFFMKYSDRILFGSDMGPDTPTYRLMYRFLETRDEYFNYSPEPVPPQGRWCIYGLDLPDEVLERVYACNAKRLLRL